MLERRETGLHVSAIFHVIQGKAACSEIRISTRTKESESGSCNDCVESSIVDPDPVLHKESETGSFNDCLVSSIVDPDPVGSETLSRVRIRADPDPK